MPSQFHTIGKLALQIGVQFHHLDRLCRLQKVPFITAGKYRLIAEQDIPAVREACIQAGYLKTEQEISHVG